MCQGCLVIGLNPGVLSGWEQNHKRISVWIRARVGRHESTGYQRLDACRFVRLLALPVQINATSTPEQKNCDHTDKRATAILCRQIAGHPNPELGAIVMWFLRRLLPYDRFWHRFSELNEGAFQEDELARRLKQDEIREWLVAQWQNYSSASSRVSSARGRQLSSGDLDELFAQEVQDSIPARLPISPRMKPCLCRTMAGLLARHRSDQKRGGGQQADCEWQPFKRRKNAG